MKLLFALFITLILTSCASTKTEEEYCLKIK